VIKKCVELPKFGDKKKKLRQLFISTRVLARERVLLRNGKLRLKQWWKHVGLAQPRLQHGGIREPEDWITSVEEEW